ncbi:nucleotidyltransferase domain-containing protein [Pseudolysobacter antarcticus]|uniref:Nucleotidyltransferase domain-containing protein n=1 Tax=Pseudolysobacter antarcticus TaxID=2511995 RepID=A0A411HPP3_9GAMM|nr:nucleotidyltransferase domain-containing protein [Pseudolysobacter antarcticus]QBB72445.1 nucleotidyltransferase domain-containing protein [Pseudolysobacter antarcticus]
MIPADIHQEIMRRLAATEKDQGVRIVLAIESGSRAWGFASPNSDFDVRFIYARPADWYLAVDLEERRDVIEYDITDDIDLNGWDLRKALRLFWKSNPAFVEWIQSPIKYIESGGFAVGARALLPAVYSNERGIHHYRSMAKTNYRGYLRADSVPLKKYFYALRPLLSVRWIERYGSAAPIEFEKLLHLIEGHDDLLRDIALLLEKKRAAPELGLSEPITRINTFIEAELQRLETYSSEHPHPPNAISSLNALFHSTLRESPQG